MTVELGVQTHSNFFTALGGELGNLHASGLRSMTTRNPPLFQM